MTDYTSFIPGGSPIPEPPPPKWIGIVFSVFVSILLTMLIGFIFFEFSMDLIGKPLEFAKNGSEEFEEKDNSSRERMNTLQEVVSQFRLLSPLPRSVVPGGDVGNDAAEREVVVLCTWEAPENSKRASTMPLASLSLYVDDVLQPWDVQFGQNTWMARCRLQPGLHVIRTPVFEVPFFVEGDVKAPKDWKKMRSHAIAEDSKRCGDCHFMIDRPGDMVRTGRDLTVGPWKGGDACMSCHEMETFKRGHLHDPATYGDCRLCHAIHGTTEDEKPLLKASKSRLCVQCHEWPVNERLPYERPMYGPMHEWP